MSFFEKGAVRIHYEEAGSGFPLLLIAGGGLNSNIAGITGDYPPFNAIKEFGAKSGKGYDIDPARIKESKEEAERLKVEDKVLFAGKKPLWFL